MKSSSPSPRRPRVLQVAYACEPYYGSEQGVGWNWATQMGRTCDVWVICCADDCQGVIEQYLEENGSIPHVTFVFLPQPKLQCAIHKFSRWLPFINFFAFKGWHYQAFLLAKKLHADIGFDLVHHVNFIGYREPGYLWKLEIPFVWGPIGGVQNCPWRFSLPWGLSRIKENLRTICNSIQLRTSLRVRLAAARAAVRLTANSTAKRYVEQVLGYPAILLNENGIKQIVGKHHEQRDPSEPLRLLWIGNLTFSKALDLVLHALSRLPSDSSFKLRVVGDGKLHQDLQKLGLDLGISENIEWLGRIPHEEALQQYRWADVFVFSSLRDTTGTVILEAFANGLPVICLDHQGAHDIVTERCGIKIPVTNPQAVIKSIADAVAECARDRDLVRRMSDAALEQAELCLWDRQGERLAEIYRQVLEKHGRSPDEIRIKIPSRSTTNLAEVAFR
ncbi:glycosyltransferase family 4 protein [Bythopirellula polymerisocia]|uniref:D-inositol 3-phosphate glycosyltransferase n=1 Tax=Bythopirellula polymerisocia TaxID=2528003 RepID=A0A5C6CBU4_9BACT|nr:glycosyltransferase family 4 protein [Bythopirellula polymerisocia]TWU20876.1 D-inositol 3-phosphate glycosyltransferase [Bythopirellula polymerisocia]